MISTIKSLVLLPIFILILISTCLFGCSANNNKEIKDNTESSNGNNINAHNVTIEDIKKKYGEDKVCDIQMYSEAYALLEMKSDETPLRKFILYNLKTNDEDILPTGIYKVKIAKILNPDMIVLSTTGENYVNSHHEFPHYIQCMRDSENTKANSNGIFTAVDIPKYYSVKELMYFGDKWFTEIIDIKVTLQGMEILFGPIKGKEEDFDLDITIPKTKVSFNEEQNQFVFEFEKTGISNKLNMNNSNRNEYFSSIKVEEGKECSRLIVNLNKSTTKYTVKADIMKDFPLPYMRVDFSNSDYSEVIIK